MITKGSIRTAVFPVAGLGTRFLPATKAIPKEMLPVVDKPLIQYAVEEALEAGIDRLVFVTNPSKRAIADHFDRAHELHGKLAAQEKSHLLEQLAGVIPDHASCIYVTQAEALGLGHAILCAASAVGDEPFAILLPDDMILNPERGALRQMLDVHEETGASVIGVETVPAELTDRYGIVEVEAGPGGWQRIRSIVEKPAPREAPSTLAVVGRYILAPQIFEQLRNVGAGAGGEIQLTDGIAAMLGGHHVIAYPFAGTRYDCGSREGYLKAMIDYAIRDDELREALLAHMSAVLDRNRS